MGKLEQLGTAVDLQRLEPAELPAVARPRQVEPERPASQQFVRQYPIDLM